MIDTLRLLMHFGKVHQTQIFHSYVVKSQLLNTIELVNEKFWQRDLERIFLEVILVNFSVLVSKYVCILHRFLQTSVLHSPWENYQFLMGYKVLRWIKLECYPNLFAIRM